MFTDNTLQSSLMSSWPEKAPKLKGASTSQEEEGNFNSRSGDCYYFTHQLFLMYDLKVVLYVTLQMWNSAAVVFLCTMVSSPWIQSN